MSRYKAPAQLQDVVKVRLPGYRDGDRSATVATLLIKDLNLNRIE